MNILRTFHDAPVPPSSAPPLLIFLLKLRDSFWGRSHRPRNVLIWTKLTTLMLKVRNLIEARDEGVS